MNRLAVLRDTIVDDVAVATITHPLLNGVDFQDED